MWLHAVCVVNFLFHCFSFCAPHVVRISCAMVMSMAHMCGPASTYIVHPSAQYSMQHASNHYHSSSTQSNATVNMQHAYLPYILVCCHQTPCTATNNRHCEQCASPAQATVVVGSAARGQTALLTTGHACFGVIMPQLSATSLSTRFCIA
jgi:hypothetical protein